MSAAVWVPVSEPRSLAATRTESARRKRIAQRQRPCAVAYDGCIARIGRGADLFEPHDLLALDGLVDGPPPIDVLKVAILARAHETDWRDLDLLRLRAGIVLEFPAPARGVERAPMH